MKKSLLFLVFIVSTFTANAQIGIGTLTPDHSSALDIRFDDKGVLLSRVALTGTTDEITIASPSNSLMVYNTATVDDITPGYYYWNAIKRKWTRLIDAALPTDGWSLGGNSGTVPGTHFIGTTDDTDVVFKRANIQAGIITSTTYNTSFGVNSYKGTPRGSFQGRWNTAIGYNSLSGNEQGLVVGHDNVGVGANSLANNYEGARNTALGSETLRLNTLGENNTAIGFQSLKLNKSGNNNVAAGAYTLTRNTSNNNVAIGYASLSENDKGTYNTAVGASSLHKNSVGKNNTSIGGDALFQNTIGTNNTAVGQSALYHNLSGSDNTSVGFNSGPLTRELNNTTAIGNGAQVSSSNSIQLGNSAVTSISGQVPFSTTSDRRYKENIQSLPLGLDFIKLLHPVEYTRKNNALNTKEWGLIAQELQQTLILLNYNHAGIIQDNAQSDAILSVRYNDLIAPLIKSIQELSDQNLKLENVNLVNSGKISQLETELQLLKSAISQLKQ